MQRGTHSLVQIFSHTLIADSWMIVRFPLAGVLWSVDPLRSNSDNALHGVRHSGKFIVDRHELPY